MIKRLKSLCLCVCVCVCVCMCVCVRVCACVFSQEAVVEIAFIPGKGPLPSSTSLHNGVQRGVGNGFTSGRLKVHVRSPEVSFSLTLPVFFPHMSLYFFLSYFLLSLSLSLSLSIFLLHCQEIVRSFVQTSFSPLPPSLPLSLSRSGQRRLPQCLRPPLTSALQTSTFQVHNSSVAPLSDSTPLLPVLPFSDARLPALPHFPLTTQG